jgi:branched-chain amino acid transport system ATP-binding protein
MTEQASASAAPEGRRTPMLEVRDVGKRFGEIVALKGVSFDVADGEVLGVAGPNGSGKSTLFNVITGLYPGTGRVVFQGEDISRRGPNRVCRRGIARTFQLPQTFATMTVEDNVRVGAHFGGRAGRRKREVISEALELTGLIAKRLVLAKHLDLLDKKLTMLAAALSTQPKMLLLDEPMGGLSPSEISRLGSLLIKLNRQRGLSLIVIEHKVRKLVELSDRMMILYNGERVSIGPPHVVVNEQRVIDLYLGKAIGAES